MIRWRGHIRERAVVGFGLLPLDISRLMIGQPINIYGRQFGVEFDMLIHFGVDEKKMIEELKAGGLIDDVLKVRNDR